MHFKMLKFFSVALSALPTLSIAAPVVVESLAEAPDGWHEVRSPAPDKPIKFSIGLHSDNHENFERTIYAISDPDHELYGKHLSRDDAKALLSPREGATESVKRWLSEAGVPENQVRDDGQWIHVSTTIDKAEGLLNTRFGIFARDEDDGHIVRTLEYSVPGEVRDFIASIQPTTFFHSIEKARNMERSLTHLPMVTKRNGGGGGGGVDLNQCKTYLTPACIRKLYKMPAKDYPKAHKDSLYAVVGFLNQTAQYDQLEEFLRRFVPDLQGTTFSEALVNGGENPQGDQYYSGEANMNTQYAIALAHKVPVQYISVGGENYDFIPDLDIPNQSSPIEPYLELATYLLNVPKKKLPQTVSISWGVSEQHIPKSYARQVCNMFGQVGARGVSVLVATGNFGTGASCMSNDGKNTTKFIPGFPASCPYVTAVGGTESNTPEVVWSSLGGVWSAGGGFSEYWSRPSWQENAVKKWVNKHGNEWKAYYNQKGRAFPDVSALAWGHQVMNHNDQETSGGTSAASPVFGAMVALLNNERLRKNKPPLGFLNPWIYKNGEKGFTDITQGKTNGCGGNSVVGLPSPLIPNAGWKAVKGWDPATGWGTPLFDKLKRLAT